MNWLPNRFINMLTRPRQEWQTIAADRSAGRAIVYAILQLFITGLIVFLLIVFRHDSLDAAGTITQKWLNVVATYIFYDMQIEGQFPVTKASVAIVLTALALAANWLLDALIVNLFAPVFRAKRSYRSSLKLVAFSLTPFFLIGFLSILPALRMISVLLAAYFFVLLWLGLPVLLPHPKEKRLRYFLLSASVVVLVYLSNVMIGPLFILGQLLFI